MNDMHLRLAHVPLKARWEALGTVVAVVPAKRRTARRADAQPAQLGLAWGKVAA